MSADPPLPTKFADVQTALEAHGITASVVLDRLLEVLELKRDVDLASKLAVSKATISTWRSRNKIPYDAMLLMYLEDGIDLIYCFTGQKIGAGDGYPGYHAGLEVAAVVKALRDRYGSSENWRLEAKPWPKPGGDEGAQ